jgi:hypothetical protein
VLLGCKGAKDARPPQDRIIYKKRGVRVTQSQAHPLYSLDYCAAGNASEAH